MHLLSIILFKFIHELLLCTLNIDYACNQWLLTIAESEVLALKHDSRILGQWSNPVSGSRKSQASSPWDKQCLTCSIMEKSHTGLDECPWILLFYLRARNSVADVVMPHTKLAHWDLELTASRARAPTQHASDSLLSGSTFKLHTTRNLIYISPYAT